MLQERVDIAVLDAAVFAAPRSKLTEVNLMLSRIMSDRGSSEDVMGRGARLRWDIGVERMRSPL